MAPAGREVGDHAQAVTRFGQVPWPGRPGCGTVRRAVVDDRHADRGAAAPDQDLEPSALAGAGVLDGVAGQLGHARHSVAGRRAARQGPGHEPAGLPDLVRAAREDPPPRAGDQPRALPGELGQQAGAPAAGSARPGPDGGGRGRGGIGTSKRVGREVVARLGFRYLNTGR